MRGRLPLIAWLLLTLLGVASGASAQDAATSITQSVPVHMTVGQSCVASVTMKNSGSTTWTADGQYRLGVYANGTPWSPSRAYLPAGVSVAPGATYTFSFTLTAPATSGVYDLTWRMLIENVAWFGDTTPDAYINVVDGSAVQDASTYISQSVSSQMVAGQSYAVSVTMQNSGTGTWTDATGYRLGSQAPQDGTTWGLSRAPLPSGTSVAPGSQITFSFSVTAPTAPGTYPFQWRVVHDGVQWFGDFTPNVGVTVVNAPSPPTGLAAAPGNGQVGLSWSAVVGASEYNVQRSAVSGGPYTTVAAGVNGTSYVDAGLTDGTAYFYVVSTVNAAGVSAPSGEASATPQAPPAAPTGLTATGADRQVALAWSAVTGADGYNVKRGAGSGGPYTTIASVSAVSAFTDTGLTNGTAYFYVVTAIKGGVEGAASTEASAVPNIAAVYRINCGGDAAAPFAAEQYGTGGATTSVTGSIDTSGVTNPAPQAVYQSIRFGPCGYVLPGLTPGGAYTVRLHFSENYWGQDSGRLENVTINGDQVLSGFSIHRAAGNTNRAVVEPFNATADSGGTITIALSAAPGSQDPNPCINGIEVIAGGFGPAMPASLTATAGDTQVALAWSASSGATGYNLYRGTSAGGEGNTPYQTGLTSPAYTDTAVTDGTAYFYRITALGSGGESAKTPEVTATPIAPADVPDWAAAAPADGQVTVSWAASPWAVGYRVQRATVSGGPYTTVAAGVAGTSYADTGLTDGTPYYYVVSAANALGESVVTDETSATPLASASASAPAPAYGYTGDGLRAWKQTASGPLYFLYDGETPVCEMDGAGGVSAVNTFGPTGLLSRYTPGGGSVFYAFDPVGSVSERMDGAGNVLGQYAFDAFGLRAGTDSTTDPYASFGGQWGYHADAETGLELLTHRYYDSGTGRFVTRDPISYNGGLNIYNYTANNPVNYNDAGGLRRVYINDPANSTPPTVIMDAGGSAHIPAYNNTKYAVDIPNSQSLSDNMDFALQLRGGYYGNPYLGGKLLAPYVANGTVGDYGKNFGMYPSGKCNPSLAHQRRFGANFNYGAMGAAAGMPLSALLLSGDVLSIEHVHKLHPQQEQDAIEDGFYYFYLTHPSYASPDGVSLPAGLVIHMGPSDYDPN